MRKKKKSVWNFFNEKNIDLVVKIVRFGLFLHCNHHLYLLYLFIILILYNFATRPGTVNNNNNNSNNVSKPYLLQ